MRESLPEMLQAMIDQCVALAGAGEDMSFGDLYTAWQEVGPMIEEASEVGRSRAAAGAPAEA